MGWFSRTARKEAKAWNHTNAFNFLKPARKPPRRSTALDACRAKAKRLEAVIKQKNNEIRQLKRVNQAQKPMKTDGVNPGTYEYYDAGLRRILMILNTNGNWATTLVPNIRAEVNGLLGTNSQWRKK